MPADEKTSDPLNEDHQADTVAAGLGRALEGLTASLRASSEAFKSLDIKKRIEVWLTAQREL